MHVLPEGFISAPRPCSTQLLAGFSAGYLLPHNQQDRNIFLPISGQVLNVISSSQAPKPPDVSLPFRGKRLSYAYQRPGISGGISIPSYQEAYRSARSNFIHSGKTTEVRGNIILHPRKVDHTNSLT